MTWHCAICLADWPAPFCDCCGAKLKTPVALDDPAATVTTPKEEGRDERR